MRQIIVVLHNVRSLHNVGSIFRTADAAGVKKIYLCGITPAPVDRFGKIRPQLKKVSLGAETTVQWDASARSARAIAGLLEKLKKEGYKIFAVEQSEESISFDKIRAKYAMTRHSATKIALILGNEVVGLPPSILKKADKILEIPMRGEMIRSIRQAQDRQAHHKESLNVAVAFGIAVFRLIY